MARGQKLEQVALLGSRAWLKLPEATSEEFSGVRIQQLRARNHSGS
jgi:hypothetical protein